MFAPNPMPEFARSTVDGYAVNAKDTYGVSDSIPGYLKLVGEVPMGASAPFSLPPCTCALIHTGGMLPAGANAVVMLEYTQQVDNRRSDSLLLGQEQFTEIEIVRPVAEGENTLQIGEDIQTNGLVLDAGIKIRPVDIGCCMALGITALRIAKKPVIGILSTGDEVVYPESLPKPGQVRDINSYILSAMVTEAGGEPVNYGIIPDNLQKISDIARTALSKCDCVVITAGSSASTRDMTAQVINTLGQPGVVVHGLNVRPGKPTILGVCDSKAVIGLPGNPVSAFMIARIIVLPLIEKLLGLLPKPKPSVYANLTINIPSQAGREDWIAVKLQIRPSLKSETPRTSVLPEEQWLAEPVFGKSNFIISLADADGVFCIPPDVTGFNAGERVEVKLI